MNLTSERLREVLDYNPETGDFTWKETLSVRAVKGRHAGTSGDRSVVTIRIDKKHHKAHRLVWLYVYGVWPSGMIDHIDGNPANNAIANLRDCTMTENLGNSKKRKNNTSGFKGVTYSIDRKHRHKPWRVALKVAGKRIRTGGFTTPEEAHEKYKELALEHFGEFARFD